MTAAQDQTVRLSKPLRVLTLYVALTMAFALGIVFAFATRLQPHLVALAFGLALLGSIYSLSLGMYRWIVQRRATVKSTIPQ